MIERGVFSLGLVSVTAVLVFAFPVSAQRQRPERPEQQRPERPYRALFGGVGRTVAAKHALDATFSLGTTYEENARLRGDLSANGPLAAGTMTGWPVLATGGLSYAWQGPNLRVGAGLGTSAWSNDRLRTIVPGGMAATVGIGAKTWGGLQTSASASAMNASAYMYQAFMASPGNTTASPLATPDRAFVPGTDAFAYQTPGGSSLAPIDTYVYQVSAGLGRGITFGPRSTVSLSASGGFMDIPGAVGDARQAFGAVGGRYFRGLTRNATLRLGYGFSRAQYLAFGTKGNYDSHDLDVGVDYGKTLSLFRRTDVAFGAGSTAVNAPPFEGRRTFEYRTTGSVSLNHEIGRSWRAMLSYGRGVSFVRGFSGPIFSDGIGARAYGMVTPRIDVTAAAGFSVGKVMNATIDAPAGAAVEDSVDAALDVALDAVERMPTASTGLDFYSATLRVRVALNRMLAAYAEGVYYRYAGGTQMLPLSGVLPTLDSRGVRMGLTMWAPIWRR